MRYKVIMMGKLMDRRILWATFLIAAMVQNAVAADPSMFIGDPIGAFQKLPVATQNNIKLVVGLVAIAAIIIGLIALFASSAKSSAGAAIGHAAMRNEGMSNMVHIVAVAVVLIIAIGVFWFFMTSQSTPATPTP